MRVLVFDVNETLLDLAALDEPFQKVFGSMGWSVDGGAVRREWFDHFIRSMLVSIVAGPYVPFPKIGRAALETIAQRHGRAITDDQAMAILSRICQLPAHPDVRPALERLRERGFRLATLTNSTGEVAEAQLDNAGIRDLFERVLSADRVKRLKPAPEPYHMAAAEMGVAPSEVRLVAAHDWDVAGALAAGCAAAFVAREGRVPDALYPRPDVIGADLSAVADAIIAAER